MDISIKSKIQARRDAQKLVLRLINITRILQHFEGALEVVCAPKVKFFVWLASTDHCWTADHLACRGLQHHPATKPPKPSTTSSSNAPSPGKPGMKYLLGCGWQQARRGTKHGVVASPAMDDLEARVNLWQRAAPPSPRWRKKLPFGHELVQLACVPYCWRLMCIRPTWHLSPTRQLLRDNHRRLVGVHVHLHVSKF